jgi:hypothetical protein
VTTPVFDIVATAVLLETQGLVEFAVPEPVNWEVWVVHKVKFPVMIGFGFTVTE